MEREALKLALETFESMNHDDSIFKGEFDGEIAVIKKALAQEPKSVTYNEVADSMNSLRKGNSVQKAYAEEVGKLKLYTSPPQRPWVGLTAQEAAECWTTSATQTWKNFEAKLKEKNNG